MERNLAIAEIRKNWRELIPQITEPAQTRVNGEVSYVCPLCGHGKHGDGITRNPASKDGNGLKCFGCGFSGDIIDLFKEVHSGADFNTLLNSMADTLGIVIDRYSVPASERVFLASTERTEKHIQNGMTALENATEGRKTAIKSTADYSAYYQQCVRRIKHQDAASYLQARGISVATAEAYMIGFDPESDPANAPGAQDSSPAKKHPAPRIIIPTSNAHYIGRSIDPNTEKRYQKLNPNREKGAGAAGIFNINALYTQEVQAVFVVEGAFDALSVIEAGSVAIALNGASNTGILLKTLEETKTKATMILCLDNDKAGNKANEALKDGFRRLNISFITADICGSYKDPNEYLQHDRAAFIEAVEYAQHKTSIRPDNTSYYISNLMAAEIDRFRAGSNIKTGYENLDEKTGGLYAGLYVIAAISSLGKTTFSAQMADQIAAAGNDVLFFSMEQSRLEMVSKSIARRTFINDPETAVTSLSIRRGYIPRQVQTAALEYAQEVQERISIVEGNFQCDIAFIGDYIRQYIKRTGTRPVVFIDYLQILQPGSAGGRHQTVKETVDISMTELKRLSRELDLTMFVVSSVNRANYLSPIDFESLKESGSIEYTADVIWGLQLQCLNDPVFDKQNNIKERREKVKKAKAEMPRKIELSCLKNRYGVAAFSAYFDYYPANDYFQATMDDGEGYTPKIRKAGRKL